MKSRTWLLSGRLKADDLCRRCLAMPLTTRQPLIDYHGLTDLPTSDQLVLSLRPRQPPQNQVPGSSTVLLIMYSHTHTHTFNGPLSGTEIYSEEIMYICNVSIITIQQQLIVSQLIQIFILKHNYRKYRIYIKNIPYYRFFENVIFSILTTKLVCDIISRNSATEIKLCIVADSHSSMLLSMLNMLRSNC